MDCTSVRYTSVYSYMQEWMRTWKTGILLAIGRRASSLM
ncbi:hypothetical protein J2Y41_004242 [Arthrobacter sp. 1088]|nr:hypothetical protein [Arthrobacter sp. 1088]